MDSPFDDLLDQGLRADPGDVGGDIEHMDVAAWNDGDVRPPGRDKRWANLRWRKRTIIAGEMGGGLWWCYGG